MLKFIVRPESFDFAQDELREAEVEGTEVDSLKGLGPLLFVSAVDKQTRHEMVNAALLRRYILSAFGMPIEPVIEY